MWACPPAAQEWQTVLWIGIGIWRSGGEGLPKGHKGSLGS